VKQNWRFHFGELLLIWSMITTASGIAYTGLLRTFIINITTPKWFTTTSGSLGDLLIPLTPPSLFPKDPGMLATLYSGMEGALDILANNIARWADKNGLNATAISTLSLGRLDVPNQPTSYMYEPSICLVAQGVKRVVLGDTGTCWTCITF
jgi:hypothetical protein